MDYPHTIDFTVDKVFGEQKISITLYSGVTTLVGTNASGKTQTLKALRNKFKKDYTPQKVRYLSSNRLGTMERYRSKTNQNSYAAENYSFGDQSMKKVRHQIETASGDFFTLDDRKDVYIKVAERLSVLFKRQISIRWDAGNMKVFFEKTGIHESYSVAAEASGLVNVISILAALFDETIEYLLIDEPEVSLHPQLQSYLLREIYNASIKYNKTIIFSTHSSQMIQLKSASNLSDFVFFKAEEPPKQIPPDAPELESKVLKDFILRMSNIYTDGFFAKKVLLIEGASDMIICHYLNNRLDLNLDIAGTQIIPVDGKGQFPAIAKLFHLIGKDVSILTDLDGFTDDSNIINLFAVLPLAEKIANSHGSSNLPSMIRDIKTAIDDTISKNEDDMTDIYASHPYWINRESEAEENKIMRRAIIAKLFENDVCDFSDWPNSHQWGSLKTRIVVLFDILEELGCFVLRKGAIESYYIYESATVSNGKPSSAALEITQLVDTPVEEIRTQYNDLVRALEYASLDKKVDESYAVRKELYSELALVLGILPHVTQASELSSAIKQTKGSSESLFNYTTICSNERNGVEVSLHSEIINVDGFPFQAFIGDNVNQLIDFHIKPLS